LRRSACLRFAGESKPAMCRKYCDLFDSEFKVMEVLEISRTRDADQQLNGSNCGRNHLFLNCITAGKNEKTHNTRLDQSAIKLPLVTLKLCEENMRIFLLLFAFLLLASTAQAKDVQLFNPDIFGQPTSTAVKLLIDKKSDEVEPYMVTTDIKCGKYSAASIFYRGKLTFDDIRTTINKSFKNYENLSLLKPPVQAIWRVKDQRFGISLSEELRGRS